MDDEPWDHQQLFIRSKWEPDPAQIPREFQAHISHFLREFKPKFCTRRVETNLTALQTWLLQANGNRTTTDTSNATYRYETICESTFVIIQWSKEDPISFSDCPSALLVADAMMKQTGRTKFYEHMDIIMGGTLTI